MHSKLFSPSGLKLAMNCPASVLETIKLREDGVIEEVNEQALRGNRIHSYAEFMLKEMINKLTDNCSTYSLDEVGKSINADEWKVAELCVEKALEIRNRMLKACGGELIDERVEARLQYDKDTFGTGDYVMAGLSNAGILVSVLDFKTGFLPVQPKFNPQLMLYALMYVLELFPLRIREIRTIKTLIFQPLISHDLAEHNYSVDEILTFQRSFNSHQKRVYNAMAQITGGCGKLDGMMSESYYCVTDECRFCPAINRCHVYDASLKKGMESLRKRDLSELSLNRLANFKGKRKEIEKFLDEVDKRIYSILINGGSVPGYKLVSGVSKRSFRKDLSEKDIANELVKIGATSVRDCFNISLKGIGDIEKMVTEIPDDLVTYSEPGPTVAPESDKRASFIAKKVVIDESLLD